MKLLTAGVIVVSILAVVFAGCTSQQPAPVTTTTPFVTAPPVTATTAPTLAGLAGNWQLTMMTIQDGTAPTYPTTAITLAFGNDGQVSGNGGCNNYYGPFTLTGQETAKGSGITIGPLGSTKMYCAATSSQESLYLGILGNTMAYDIDGTTKLVLTDTNQNVLVFQRPSAIPNVTEGMLPA